MNTDIEERVSLKVDLNSEDNQICEPSIPEVVLYYMGNPNLFFNHLYESLSTMSWKFYLFNKNE